MLESDRKVGDVDAARVGLRIVPLGDDPMRPAAAMAESHVRSEGEGCPRHYFDLAVTPQRLDI